MFVSLHKAVFVPFQENTVIEEDFSSDSDDQVSSVRSVEYLNYLKLLLMLLTMWQFAFKVSNSAITALLRFMRYFIQLIGRAFSSDAINDIGHSIPLTLSTLHKLISLEKDHFTNFVVCPKCDSVHCKNGDVGMTPNRDVIHLCNLDTLHNGVNSMTPVKGVSWTLNYFSITPL